MRVLLVPVGSRGDVQPLLALGQRLKARGHPVILACSPDFGEWGRSLGLEVRTYGPSVVALSHEIGNALRRPYFFMKLLRHHFAEHFDGVRDNAGDCDVIVGAGAQGAMTTIAEWKGVPCFYVAYCPQILPSPGHDYPPMPVQAQWLGRTGNALAWWATIRGWNLAFGGLMNAQRARLGLAAARDAYHMMFRGGEVILAADPVLGPAPASVNARSASDGRDGMRGPAKASGIPVTQTGPFTLADAGETLPAEVDRFLATPGAPVVYFGFGSMVSDDPAHVTDVIVEAADRAGVRALISAGWAKLGNGVLPRGCMTVGPLPHAELFPRIAGAVHHGGAGTTHAVARAGIPQVVVPHLLDQFFWGERVVRVGIGAKPVPAATLDARRLASAIRAALAPGCSARARAQGDRMRRAPDGADAAAERIERATSQTGRRVTTA